MRDHAIEQPGFHFARRLQRDPRFVAYALHAYCQQEGLEFAELAAEWGLAPEMLTRLALCRRPAGDSPSFANEVRAIADYTLADETQLANLLRQVESLERLAQMPAPPMQEGESQLAGLPSGILAAARDREESEEVQPAPPDEQRSTDE